MKRILRRARAKEHILEQADFLAVESGLELAVRFLDAAEAAFQRLLDHPEIGSPRPTIDPRLSDLRVWPVPGFPNHLVFYRPHAEGIEVIDVLHGARDLDQKLGES